LFEKTANTERFEHFAEEAELAGLVDSDADNLKDAIQGESREIDSMYLEFAEKARVAGDTSAAARFAGIRTFTLFGLQAGLAGWFWSNEQRTLAVVLLAVLLLLSWPPSLRPAEWKWTGRQRSPP
jgi:hypothetical protein